MARMMFCMLTTNPKLMRSLNFGKNVCSTHFQILNIMRPEDASVLKFIINLTYTYIT